MANLADDDDFGDFVMVTPAQTAPVQVQRLDSFDFGGPVKAADPPKLSAVEATPAANKAPLPPSPISDMLMSMHGLKKENHAAGGTVGGKTHPPLGGSSDPFSLDFAFSESSSKVYFSNPISKAVPSEGLTATASSGATGNDWDDFAAVKPRKAAHVGKPVADVIATGADVITSGADVTESVTNVTTPDTVVITADADISDEVLRPPPKPPLLSSIHPPLSWTTGVRTSPRHPDSKSGLTARVTRSPRSSPHGSPRSSPQRSSPRARRSSLEPATSSPRSSTLSRPSSQPERPKSDTASPGTSKPESGSSKTKPGMKSKGGAVLIGNLMPLNGQRERRASNPDLNQARFAMAAGLASEWASDFAGQEGVSAANEIAPAVKAPAPVADLMDWGEDETAGTGVSPAPAAPPDADFGDDFGDFVSATSSTSTSRRTSDFDFFSSETPSEALGQPNGLSSGLHEEPAPASAVRGGNALQGLFAAGGTRTGVKHSATSHVAGVTHGANHVVGAQSATESLDLLGEAFSEATGSLNAFPGDSFPTFVGQQGGSEKSPGQASGGLTGQSGIGLSAAFDTPLVVDLGTDLGGVKQGGDSLTPQSTQHSTAPPLFPDPEPFGEDSLAVHVGVRDPLGGLPVGQSEAMFGPVSGFATGQANVLPTGQASPPATEQASALSTGQAASKQALRSASGEASDTGGESSVAKFGVKESGRLSRSMFGEDSDEESESMGPGIKPGVSTAGAKSVSPAVSLEALLSSSEYQTSIAKAWGGSEHGAPGGRTDQRSDGPEADVGTAEADVGRMEADVGGTAPAPEVLTGNGFGLQGVLEMTSALESLGSFSFGPAVSVLTIKPDPFGGLQSPPDPNPQDEDDDFGDFAAAETSAAKPNLNEFSGADAVGTADTVTPGSSSLDDALFGGFEFPSGVTGTGLENGFSLSGVAGSLDTGFAGGPGLSEKVASMGLEVSSLFGSFDVSSSTGAAAPPQVDPFGLPEGTLQDSAASSQPEIAPVGAGKAADVTENGRPAAALKGTGAVSHVPSDLLRGNEETSMAAFEDDDGFGDFVDSRRSSATVSSTTPGDPFTNPTDSRRVSGAVASTPGDDSFAGGFHDSARSSFSGDPFGGPEGLVTGVSAVGSTNGFRGSEEKGGESTGDGFGVWAGFSNGDSAPKGLSNGVKGVGDFGGLESSSAGQVSSNGLDFDFLSSGASAVKPNQVMTNKAQDPFLDLMGMDVSVPSTSESLQGFDFGGPENQISAGVSGTQGLPGFGETQVSAGVSEHRRSFSERRQRRERSRQSSSVSEGESVQNQGSHSRAASWQAGANRTLERTIGSAGSGKRSSYKESDLLEVGMQLLEDGRVAEARACWAHVQAQRKLPEKKAQYERAMISSPMKAFDIMKEIHDLEASLAPAHQVATWQKPPGIGSRRSSSNASENGRRSGRSYSDVPVEAQRAFVRAWEDLAHACADELEEGQEIWQGARDAGCDQELLRTPKGRQYFASLCRIYLVSALLSALSQWRKPWLAAAGAAALDAAASGEGLRSRLADCRRVAEGDLGRALRVASERTKGLGFIDVWAAARGAVLEAAVGTSAEGMVGKGRKRSVCALTLVLEGALQGVSLITWQGQTFLAPVANMWRNRVSEQPPHGLAPL